MIFFLLILFQMKPSLPKWVLAIRNSLGNYSGTIFSNGEMVLDDSLIYNTYCRITTMVQQ